MKVRVKATGEIKDVARGIYSPYQYVDKEGTIYTEDDVEELPGDDGAIFFDPTIDYWTRLEHQAAIAAMQGFLAGGMENTYEFVAEFSINQATALVEKLKSESNGY
jgi:hypothetical protein